MTLPRGWSSTTLAHCVSSTRSVDPRQCPAEKFDLFSVPSYTNYKPECVRGADVGSTKQEVQPGDVLLCKIVPHIRRGWVVPAANGNRQIASGEWIVFREHGLDPHYLRRFLLSDGFHEKFMRTVSGVGGSLMRARPAEAGKIELPVPPLSEQRRIVAKLDALTARLARARAELDRVPVLAKNLRASTLHHAVLGRLQVEGVTQTGWSRSERDAIEARRGAYLRYRRGSRLSSDVRQTVDYLAGERAGWLDCRLADVIGLRVGHAFRSADYVQNGVALLRGANIAPGRIDWSEKASVSSHLAVSYERFRLAGGDIVLAMDRPLISGGLKIARLPEEAAGCLLVQRVANPQPSDWIVTDYLLIILQSHLLLDQINKHATGSDLPHISSNDILTTRCPLPPVGQQWALANAVNTAFARADRLEAEAARARALLDRLEAAILAKAFRGELVPQDPEDEPASVLLERIRARRAAAPKARRGRRNKETANA